MDHQARQNRRFRFERFTSISTGTCCARAVALRQVPDLYQRRPGRSALCAGRPRGCPPGCSTSGLQRGHGRAVRQSLGAPITTRAPAGTPSMRTRSPYARRCEPRSVPHVRARRPASRLDHEHENSCPRVSRWPRPDRGDRARSEDFKGRDRKATLALMSGSTRGSLSSKCTLTTKVALLRSTSGTIRLTCPPERSSGNASSWISAACCGEICRSMFRKRRPRPRWS